MTYCGLPLEVVEAEAGAGGELGHVDNLDRELFPGLSMNTSSYQRKWSFSCKKESKTLKNINSVLRKRKKCNSFTKN